MKSHIKNAALFILIIAICLFRAIDYSNLPGIFYMVGFVVAALILYIIKNKYISLCLGVIILICSSLYDINCAVFSVPVFLLMVVYKSAIPKLKLSDKKNQHHATTEGFFLQLLFFLGVAGGVYFIIKSLNADISAYIGDFVGATLILLALVVVFASGCFSKSVRANVKKHHKISVQDYSALNRINFTSLFLFIITLLLCYINYQSVRVGFPTVFFPWQVWLCVLVFEKNPITETMFVLIENEIKKVSEKSGKDK